MDVVSEINYYYYLKNEAIYGVCRYVQSVFRTLVAVNAALIIILAGVAYATGYALWEGRRRFCFSCQNFENVVIEVLVQ